MPNSEMHDVLKKLNMQGKTYLGKKCFQFQLKKHNLPGNTTLLHCICIQLTFRNEYC